jgi:hypothetical protein
MTCYQLVLGAESLEAFVARLAVEARRFVPGLGEERARGLIDLVLRTRLRRCATCSREPDCGCVRPGDHLHDEARDLANICAVNAADLVVLGDQRDRVERQLAGALYATLAPVVVDGRECAQKALRHASGAVVCIKADGEK